MNTTKQNLSSRQKLPFTTKKNETSIHHHHQRKNEKEQQHTPETAALPPGPEAKTPKPEQIPLPQQPNKQHWPISFNINNKLINHY